MSSAPDTDETLQLSAAQSEDQVVSQAEPASAPVFDWWTRPATTSRRGRRGMTASASLGNGGFAQYREAEAKETADGDAGQWGMTQQRERGKRIVTSPIDISTTTPARRHRPSTSGATSPNNSSPASQFLAVFSPPNSEHNNAESGSGQVVGEYTLGRVIGTGAFGEVRRALNNNTGAVVAVKTIRKGSAPGSGASGTGPGELADKESTLWFGLSHEHILPLFATFDTPYTVYLVMLYCPAGSLLTLLNDRNRPGSGGGLPQADAGRVFSQVVSGLDYLHRTARIVHGDLKLENVLLDDTGRCYIADFGLSRPIGAPVDSQQQTGEERVNGASGLARARTWQARHSSPVASKRQQLAVGRQSFHPGSLEYAAPELLRPSPAFAEGSAESTPEVVSPAQDIWALGCILHALLTGSLPFTDSFQPRLQMKIVRGSWTMPQGLGRRAEELLLGCLCVDVAKRWDIEQVGDSAWVRRWRDREADGSRSPSGRGRARSRTRVLAEHDGARSMSTSRTRGRSRDRPHACEEPFSSPPSLHATRSPSRDRYGHRHTRSHSRQRPTADRTHSQESDEGLPPLSPVQVLFARNEGGHGRRAQDRSPSSGTPGPRTPREGQLLSAQATHTPGEGSDSGSGSRSRSRTRRLAMSGLGILPEDGIDTEDPEWERRGRKTTRALASPVRPPSASVEVKQEVAKGSFDLPPLTPEEIVAGVGRKGSREGRASRSASRDRAVGKSAEKAVEKQRRSRSVGHVLRDRSRVREEGA